VRYADTLKTVRRKLIPLGRHSLKWEDNIKMNLREVGCGYGLERSGSGQEKVAGSCECCNEILGPIKCGEFFD
jgi:hypothetical protein